MSSAGFEIGATLPTLESARLRLRWIRDGEVAALFTIFGDPEVTRYWGHGVLADLPAATALLEDIRAQFARRTLFQWGLALRDTDALIGTCTLAALDGVNRRAELGFALGAGHRGLGYMAEALPVLLQFGFRELQLHRIWADVDPRNAPAIRTLERLGFVGRDCCGLTTWCRVSRRTRSFLGCCDRRVVKPEARKP